MSHADLSSTDDFLETSAAGQGIKQKNLQPPPKWRMKVLTAPHSRGRLASSFSLRRSGRRHLADDPDEHNLADILTPGSNLAPAFPLFIANRSGS